MTTNAFDSAIRQVATASISGYQRYISPHKGFSCAHRLLYGSESCSQFVKRTISQYGLIDGIKASRRRFQACRAANQILRAKLYQVQSSEPESEEDAETSKKRQPNPSVTPINDTDCLLVVIALMPAPNAVAASVIWLHSIVQVVSYPIV